MGVCGNMPTCHLRRPYLDEELGELSINQVPSFPINKLGELDQGRWRTNYFTNSKLRVIDYDDSPVIFGLLWMCW